MTLKRMERISTGSYVFNKWLYGGYEKDVITMIAGPAGSGKTNFAILVACSQAKKGNKVIFIDTEGGFSIDRVRQIVGEDYEKILENILLLDPVSFDEQKKIFSNLVDKIKKEHANLIVVDGMAMLYRLKLGDARKEQDSYKIKNVNKEMAEQMRCLAEIARKQKIPVLITNQVYSSFVSEKEWKKGRKAEKRVNIVGGDLFKYWSKCIIQLQNDRGKRKALLLKHRSLPEKELNFEIRKKGIYKKGWI
ncbi:DNA repair and recombination protein RadB [Candidatus Pacearchaeota archaeon]|nr:DNA repair and recombination protein RadB [Candidatus Pacearchaeota archaeon]